MTGFDDRVQVLTDDGGTGLGPARWQSIGGPVVARERGLCVVATGGDGLAVLVTDGECQPWIVDRSGGNDWGPWIRVGS